MDRSVGRISGIISNLTLAEDISSSIRTALSSGIVHIGTGNTVWGVFHHSLKAAIRDIERDRRGRLFQRLIRHGPLNPDDAPTEVTDGATILSDPECGSCVNFIFSHMVNRFKGDLAELLALEPCLELVRVLKAARKLPPSIALYSGALVREPTRSGIVASRRRGRFTYGADGLLLEAPATSRVRAATSPVVHGVIEVKSMRRSVKPLIRQARNHLTRLRGGLRLGAVEYGRNQVRVATDAISILVLPAAWKLSREWRSIRTPAGRTITVTRTVPPVERPTFEQVRRSVHRVTLRWSQEAIEQAAYEMTFWYMAQVGRHVYENSPIPGGWEHMSREEAGQNAIKQMLYFIPLRYISERQRARAIKLYNVYSFSYPLGVDSKEMLWPQDFPNRRESEVPE